MRKRAVVKWQDGSTEAGFGAERYETKTGADYWQFMNAHAPFGFDDNGMVKESTPANADSLSDEDVNHRVPTYAVNAHPSGEQILLDEAKELLTEKQRIVWDFIMQEEYTQDEVADMMSISQVAVNKHFRAARKKVTEYLELNKSRLRNQGNE